MLISAKVNPFSASALTGQSNSVAKSAGYTILSQILKNVIQVVQLIVLGRMLGPEVFGKAAMVSPVLALALLFQDLGFTQVSIQKKDLTSTEASILYWYNLCIGLMIAFVIVLMSPMIASFYQYESLAPICMAMGLVSLIYAVGSQHLALLARTMSFKLIAAIESFATFVSFVVAVSVAIWSPTIWAVIVSLATYPVITTSFSWAVVDWRPKTAVKLYGNFDLVKFGLSIAISNVTNFFSRNLDNILIGKYWGAVSLGLYDRAYKLLTFPLQAIANPLGRVMIPALSRSLGDEGKYKSTFLQGYRTIVFSLMPGIVFLVSSSGTLIPFVFGTEWSGAVPIFQALGIAALCQPLNNPSGWLLLSQGRGKAIMLWGVFSAIASAIGICAGLKFGAIGVAIGYSLSEVVKTPMLWWMVTRRGHVRQHDIMSVTGPATFSVAVSLGASWIGGKLIFQNDLVELAYLALISTSSYFAVLICFKAGRNLWGDVYSMWGQARGRTRKIK